MTTETTITNEQINSLPLLLGIFDQMGIRQTIDAHLKPHGAWQGISPGTLLCVWLAHILTERTHHLVLLRDWVADRTATFESLLGLALRDTDCTDDRLATLLTMLGDPTLQATLDRALLQDWITIYRLPTDTVRFDSTSVTVYHETTDPDSLLQFGHSKDHRPDLRQFKIMLASLDPLGLPLAMQLVAGQRADDGLYAPAYAAAVATLGTSAFLAVGDSKMAALATRGTIVAGHSRYLCAYRPPSATADLAAWVDAALTRAETWEIIKEVDERTGEILRIAVIDAWTRPQIWVHPETAEPVCWEERVLVVRSQQQQDGLRERREATLQRLTTGLETLRQGPTRGRKGYVTAATLQEVVDDRVAKAGLTGIVQVTLAEQVRPHGTPAWVVGLISVDRAAWAAMVARLGWHVYVSNTTTDEYTATALVLSYRQQPVQERGFSRLKTRNLQIRPVYVRDETRISGLVWVLLLALRVVVLTEQRARQALTVREETLAGLNPASRKQTTTRPTTERMLAIFVNITMTQITGPDQIHHHVTALSPPQQHILRLLDLPPDLYQRIVKTLANSVQNLRE